MAAGSEHSCCAPTAVAPGRAITVACRAQRHKWRWRQHVVNLLISLFVSASATAHLPFGEFVDMGAHSTFKGFE